MKLSYCLKQSSKSNVTKQSRYKANLIPKTTLKTNITMATTLCLEHLNT